MMVLWMKVTADEYEFPLMIADSQKELAMMCGINRSSIAHAISKARDKGHRCSYVRVEIEEDDQ